MGVSYESKSCSTAIRVGLLYLRVAAQSDINYSASLMKQSRSFARS